MIFITVHMNSYLKHSFVVYVFIHMIPFVLLQLTAANGALCFINPLYLQEHGDDWLTQTSVSTNLNNRPFLSKRERRLSTARPWVGSGLKRHTESVEEPSASLDSSGDIQVFFDNVLCEL